MPSPSNPRRDPQGVMLVVPWDQTFGGVNSVVRNLARHLTETGHEPLSLFPGERVAPRTGLSKLGYPSVYMNLRPPVVRRRPLVSALGFAMNAPNALSHLVRLVRAHRIGVVNVHYPSESSIHFLALRRLTGARLVTSVHGSDLTGLGASRVARGTMRLVLQGSDAVIAPSESFAEYVREQFPSAAAKVIGLPNGVDLESVDAMASDPATEIPVAAGCGPYIVCVAAMNHKKAHDTLLRAFVDVPAPFRLLLVGDGPLQANVVRLVSELGLRERVVLLGAQPPTAVAKLIAGAVCSVLPSRDEPFGISAVESMGVGTPVVATAVGGLREIVVHEETGLVVPVDDVRALAAALCRLAADVTLRSRLGEAARMRAYSRFGWRQWASRYCEVAYQFAACPVPAYQPIPWTAAATRVSAPA